MGLDKLMDVRKDERKSILILLALCAWCLALAASVAEAQQRDPLLVEDTLMVHSFGGGGWSSVQFSADGRWLAYVVSDNRRVGSADGEAWARTGVLRGITGDDIYVSNTETGEARNLTGGTGENWLPNWSPDGHYLAFLSDRDGTGQAKLWVWDAVKNYLRKISDVNVRADEIEWLPDGHNILVTTIPDDLSVEEYARRVLSNGEGQKPVVEKVQDSTVAIYRSRLTGGNKEAPKSDPWNLNTALRDLAVVDVVNGKSATMVHGQRIAKYLLSPDGSHVGYTTPKRFERPGSQQVLFDLATVAIATKKLQAIVSDIRLEPDGAEFGWSPDNALLIYQTGGMEAKTNDLYTASATGGVPRRVVKMPLQQQVSHDRLSLPLWDSKSHFYFVQGGGLWRASLDKEETVKVAEIPNRRISTFLDPRTYCGRLIKKNQSLL